MLVMTAKVDRKKIILALAAVAILITALVMLLLGALVGVVIFQGLNKDMDTLLEAMALLEKMRGNQNG